MKLSNTKTFMINISDDQQLIIMLSLGTNKFCPSLGYKNANVHNEKVQIFLLLGIMSCSNFFSGLWLGFVIGMQHELIFSNLFTRHWDFL